MSSTSAYLLVAHGSRDPRPQISLEHLSYLVAGFLGQEILPRQLLGFNRFSSTVEDQKAVITTIKPSLPQLSWVGTASLEFAPIPLHQSIEQFAQQIQPLGVKSIGIIPIFLSLGVHLREDIPAQVAIAEKNLRNKINLELLPHLGSYEEIWSLVAHKLSQLPGERRIILAHGSRQAGANQAIEKKAKELGAITAYWTNQPNLETKVRELMALGTKKITIMPYFLFSGRITDEIDREVQRLQTATPELELYLGKPIGATTELAKIIMTAIKLHR